MRKNKQLSDGAEVNWDRCRLIVDGIVPQGAFEGMPDGALWIFLEEPNPEQWPKEMKPLEKYLE